MKPSIVYKIAYQEWKILMACKNMKQMYGLTFEERSISNREMLVLLHGMVQKGMLYVKEERLQLCETYEYLLELVRKSEYFFAFRYIREDAFKRGSLYLGEQLLWIENSDCRKETYEITLLSAMDWEEWILEQQFFPCYCSYEIEMDWKEIETMQSGEEKFRVQMRRVENGECDRELVLYESQGKEYLVRKDKEITSFLTYHQNHLLKELRSWM